MVARDPADNEWKTIQVKTIRLREDRGGEYVVYARRGNGEHYRKSDTDYIVGVRVAENGRLPEVYMFENRGIGEYWAAASRVEDRWTKLPIELDRRAYSGTVAGVTLTCPA